MSYVKAEAIEQILRLVGTLRRFEETPHVRPSKSALLGLSEREARDYSMFRAAAAICSIANGGSMPSCPEYEYHQTLTKEFGELGGRGRFHIPKDVTHGTHERSLSTSSGSKGGFMVASSGMSYMDRLLNRSVCFRAGATLLPVAGGNVIGVKQTTGTTVSWLGAPGTAATEGSPNFVQISGSPRVCVGFAQVPLQLIRQGGAGAEQFLAATMIKDGAIAADLGFLVGTGNSQPLGVINTPGIGSVNGASIDQAKIIEFQTDVADLNGGLNPETMVYVAPPLTAGVLAGRQRFTGTDTPLWEGSIIDGTMAGCRAMSSKQMPAGSLLFGDFSALTVLEWGPMVLEVDPFSDLNKALVGIRILWHVDSLVKHPSSFSLATSVS